MLEKTQSSRDDQNSNEKNKKKSRMKKKQEKTARRKQETTQGDTRTTQKESNEMASNELGPRSSGLQKTVSAKGKSAEEEITQQSEKAPKEILKPFVSNMRSKERVNERHSHLVVKRQRPREPASYSIGSGRDGWRKKSTAERSADTTQLTQNTSTNYEETGPKKNSSEGVKWLGIDWSWLFMTGSLASAAFNPAQIDLLAEYTRFYGGFYFFALFMFLLVAIQFPLTFLMIHCPQFTQSGLTTVAPTFGSLYRALGYGMFCYCVLNQGLLVHEASRRVDYAISVVPHMDTVVDCKMRDMDYLSNLEAKMQCSSLANGLKCANGSKQHCDGKIPSWIRVDISDKKATNKMVSIESPQRPSAKLFMRSKSLKKSFNIGHWTNHIAALSIVVIGAFACFGPTVLAGFTSIIGLTTLLLVFNLCILLMITGTPGEALLRLITLSQPQRLFSVGVFSALFDLIVAPVGLNFSLMSIASFRPRRSDSFTIASAITMIHTAVFVMLFMANVSMCSMVENLGTREHRGTSIPSARQVGNHLHWNNEHWQNFLPEFFGVFDSPRLYIFFMATEFCIYFINLISPFFAVMVIARDHEFIRRKISYRLSIGLLSGTALLLAALLYHYPNVAAQLHSPSLTGCFILFFALVFVRLYGRREFALDLSTMYPLTGTFGDYFGPFSPLLIWSINTGLPLLLLMFLACRLFVTFDFDREKEYGFTFSALLEMFLPTLPIIIFLSIFCFDLGRWFRHIRNAGKRQSMWNLAYPSNLHPSYNRILDGFGDDDEGVKLHSKETVVSVDHMFQTQARSSHTQSGKNG